MTTNSHGGIGKQGRPVTKITGTRQRVSARMEVLGLSIPNIVSILNSKNIDSPIQNQNIYNWMQRDSIPADYLNPIAEILKCNSAWLRTGEESISKTNIETNKNQVVIPIFSIEIGKSMFEKKICDALTIDRKIFIDIFKLEPSDSYIIISMKNDSNMQPLLKHGDMCIVDTDDKIPVDGVFYVQVGEYAEVKRISFLEGEMLLISDDNRYPVKRAKYNSADILGRVKYCFNGNYV